MHKNLCINEKKVALSDLMAEKPIKKSISPIFIFFSFILDMNI